MKKLIALALIASLGLTSIANAQIRKIPAAVTEAFAAKYPVAKNVSWADKITSFQAEFDMDTHKYEAEFNSKGVWQKTEKTLSEEEIPLTVKDGLSKTKYADWEIKYQKEIINNSGATEYRLYAKKNDLQKKYLYFNMEGTLIRDAITL